MKYSILTKTIIILLLTAATTHAQTAPLNDARFVTYTTNPQKQNLEFFWKDDKGSIFQSIANLKQWVTNRHRTLLFAMNGGMYQPDNSPQGLFIEQQKVIAPLNTAHGTGNFYLQPNGVFYVTTKGIPAICKTAIFKNTGNIRYATQSGPMLVIGGKMNPAFQKGSANLNIRNGVGILPSGKAVFIMSKAEINFYDFAQYFQSLGCTNALYLDGFVSRTYLPAKHWLQTDGGFGVIIGVTTNKM